MRCITKMCPHSYSVDFGKVSSHQSYSTVLMPGQARNGCHTKDGDLFDKVDWIDFGIPQDGGDLSQAQFSNGIITQLCRAQPVDKVKNKMETVLETVSHSTELVGLNLEMLDSSSAYPKP